ncbi:MAG: hypothetical protein QNJ71_00480 [Acidimicrobiia bacterium]|nr:hypothetical protein [Acidimicrobiia bacterium]
MEQCRSFPGLAAALPIRFGGLLLATIGVQTPLCGLKNFSAWGDPS